MHLKKLSLKNFRIYDELSLEFNHRPTVLLGKNAAGKSSVLEAVYLLSTTKSIRVESESELVKEKEAVCRIEGIVEDGDDETNLLITFSKEDDLATFFQKKTVLNGVSKRVIDFLGNLPAVLFSPSDINMVTGSPSLRRWHMDLGLAQINKTYKRALTQYEQFLVSRNRLLKRIKDGESRIDELEYWNDELVGNGEIVAGVRREFFEFINKLEKPLGNFDFIYKESILSKNRLQEYLSREIASGTTLIGPHRDDYLMNLYGKSLSQFGSRGEQRTGTLALKLSLLEYMAEKTGKRPILLLDDVFSELDADHRKYVVEIVSKQQTIIATVELENIPQEFLDSSNILQVEEGNINL